MRRAADLGAVTALQVIARGVASVAPISTSTLSGEVHALGERSAVVLEDRRFAHPVVLFDPLARHGEALLALARTIEPMPQRGARKTTIFDWLL